MLVLLAELHPMNHQASHQVVDMVEMLDSVLDMVADSDRDHLHLNRARTVVVLLDLMLLVLLSVALMSTMMDVSIAENSTASSNKVYKKTIQTIRKSRKTIMVFEFPFFLPFVVFI
jgi:hypothetical protein